MRQFRTSLRIISVVALIMVVNNQGASASVNCIHGWRAFPLPSAAYLNAVDAISAKDIWAVGDIDLTRVVSEHFDGSRWRLVPVPVPKDAFDDLLSVEMVSTNDGWAGGFIQHPSHPRRMLLFRWDGANWSRVQFPPPPTGTSPFGITGISAVSADDAWAVGYVMTVTGDIGVAYHWDGATWTQIPLPSDQSPYSWLNAVDAVGSTDVWAVGGNPYGALILHWDGTSWTQAPVPKTSAEQHPTLNAVVGEGNRAMAFGTQGEDECCTGSYWLRSGGSSWRASRADGDYNPSVGADMNGSDIWVVGGGIRDIDATVDHFDGKTWSFMYPRPGLNMSLNAIAATARGAWVVGSVGKAGAPNWALRSC